MSLLYTRITKHNPQIADQHNERLWGRTRSPRDTECCTGYAYDSGNTESNSIDQQQLCRQLGTPNPKPVIGHLVRTLLSNGIGLH